MKTSPVHVKQWGTFVKAKVRPGDAALAIRTEVSNQRQAEQNVRGDLDHSRSRGKDRGQNDDCRGSSIPTGARASVYQQQIAVQQPQLWSLEERNLYKLVTEIASRLGKSCDRYETPFGIRTSRIRCRRRDSLLNGKPVKLKGTCNHQDHAGVGAALPDAVQYYRVAQAAGDGLQFASHFAQSADARTAGCLRSSWECWCLTRPA